MRRLFVLILCVGINACGFQLRGSDALPESIDSVYLQYVTNTRFTRALTRALRFRGANITDVRQEADAVLSVVSDESGQRILSVTVEEGPEEYEVYQKVAFSYQVNQEILIDNKELTLTRDYTFDKDDILGKRQEFESLSDALAVQIADMLIRQLRFAH